MINIDRANIPGVSIADLAVSRALGPWQRGNEHSGDLMHRTRKRMAKEPNESS